jgi:hypothetical protein
MNQVLALGKAAFELAERVGHALRWLSPTVARLTVGLVFLQSGWGQLHDLQKVTDYFTELGLPAAAFQARLASTSEFVCGGLLLLGLATRFARGSAHHHHVRGDPDRALGSGRRAVEPRRSDRVRVHRAPRLARHRRTRSALHRPCADAA